MLVAEDAPAAELAPGVATTSPSPEAIAAALDELIDDSAARAALGAEARRVAERRYHPRAMVEAYEAIYDELFEERR